MAFRTYSHAIQLRMLFFYTLIMLTTAVNVQCESPVVNPADFQGSIVIYGDTRTDETAHRRIVSCIEQFNPIAVFNVGDCVENGNDQGQWDLFLDITKNLWLRSRYYAVMGNHELDSARFYQIFSYTPGKAWKSVDIGSLHFVLLNSNTSLAPGSEQYSWLTADCATAKGAGKTVIPIFHHPLFSSGGHGNDEKKIGPYLIPLFESTHVSIVFCGHDHDYERSLFEGIYYIVTGGGGAPLYGMANTNKYSQIFVSKHHFCLLETGLNPHVLVVDDTMNLLDRFTVSAK